MVALGDMARRFKLSSELMQTTISARLGKAIPGHLEAGVLYTAVYLARIKAQVNSFSKSLTSIFRKSKSQA